MSSTILVIEDNPDHLMLLTWALEESGYEVVGTDTAEKGLALLSHGQFDLILMDISLPGMDGREAVKFLRKDPRFATLPIIAVTAQALVGTERILHDSGINIVLTKPVDTQCLRETIESLLPTGVQP